MSTVPPHRARQLRSRAGVQRLDPKALAAADAYPAVWGRSAEEDDTLGCLLDHYAQLKAILAAGARRGLGLVVWST